MDQASPSRRQFLAAVGNLASASWITLNWPQIAVAAEQADQGGHGGHAAAAPPPAGLKTLTAAEAAEIDAIANLIVPGGTTPGAREARAVNFIDTALGSFWAAQLPSFREGLAEFATGFAAHSGAATAFSAAPEAAQTAFLHTVDETPFFLAVRRLTVLGMIALPKYGGNHEYAGWKMLGVENRHFWSPPFGYYDRDYAGFVPYPGTTIQTA
ncbi:MAG: hypothetical protein B7Z08_06555 [Sphingomonadales bacterium 32-68-7]|nr:MAG: hypothetical protein B7Z33_05840 [Sphingomonadales bacterium 12-68-11]OYX09107.1 MAG: hypothetical protein B7Z08_06555 [Sphingomonadales bacterium 32-68-7]